MQDALGFKLLVSKLSGFAKFDLDTKITKLQFFHLLEELSTELESEEAASLRQASKAAESKEEAPAEGEEEAKPEVERQKHFSEAKYSRISEIWQAALSTESQGAPFVGNLEDPVYTAIL